MNYLRYQLSPTWHVLAALVMSFEVFFVSADMLIPRSAMLQQSGHPFLAAWSVGSCFLVGVIGLAILLPRSGNLSRFLWVRILGHFHLLLRWFVVSIFAIILYGVAELLTKWAA
jgi:hypothetical protein